MLVFFLCFVDVFQRFFVPLSAEGAERGLNDRHHRIPAIGFVPGSPSPYTLCTPFSVT
jgi:hypothetical protein